MWERFLSLLRILVIAFVVGVVLTKSCQADWFRIQSSTPVRTHPHYFVATYMHRGPIDTSIPQSITSLFITVAYDLTKTPAPFFTKITYSQVGSNAAQHEIEEHVTTRAQFENRMQTEPRTQPPSPIQRTAPYERYQGTFLGDPSLDYDVLFGTHDDP